jgi:hypothetical protein
VAACITGAGVGANLAGVIHVQQQQQHASNSKALRVCENPLELEIDSYSMHDDTVSVAIYPTIYHPPRLQLAQPIWSWRWWVVSTVSSRGGQGVTGGRTSKPSLERKRGRGLDGGIREEI